MATGNQVKTLPVPGLQENGRMKKSHKTAGSEGASAPLPGTLVLAFSLQCSSYGACSCPSPSPWPKATLPNLPWCLLPPEYFKGFFPIAFLAF